MDGTAKAERTWADGWIAPAVVAAASVAVFVRAATGEFVFDDHRFIPENAAVQKPESWLRFFTDSTTVDPHAPGGIVRPLRTIEFAFDRVLFGVDPLAYHVHSFLWHALASVLLLFVLRRLVGDGRAAFVAALAWAVHPCQTESVAWISSRGDVATGACVLASILFALRAQGAGSDLAASLACAAVATLYKETAVALPIVIAVLRWLGRIRVPVWPYVLVTAAYLVYRSRVQFGSTGHVNAFLLGGSTAATFATMMRGFGFYVCETLLPAQSLDWYLTPSTTFADAAAVAWLLVHAALIASAIAFRARAPFWTLAVAWFYGFLLTVANWPFFLGIPTAERFLYLPLAGAAALLASILARAPRAAWTAAAVVVAAFGASSVSRSGMWRSDVTLWDTVLADHVSPRAEQATGQRERDEGLALRDRAFKLPPGPDRDAASAATERRFESSLGHLHRALDLWSAFEQSAWSDSDFARRTQTNASNVAYLLGRNAEALWHADEALRTRGNPQPEIHYDRALPLLKLGFAPQAMAAMREARAAGFDAPDPEIGGFFLRAAAACESDSMPDTALAGYETALAASPEGPLRREAADRIAVLRQRPRAPGGEEKERARLAALDSDLAKLPRSCPAWRDHTLVR
jgi:hypothetical protein